MRMEGEISPSDTIVNEAFGGKGGESKTRCSGF